MEQEPDPLRELRRQLKLDADPEPVLAPTLTTVRRSRAAEDDRRRLLWRDSATILIGVLLALIAGQLLIPAQTAGPTGSPTAEPSLVAIGSFGPPRSLPPVATIGPILNPSLGVDATPTPIPVITMGPTASTPPSPLVVPTSTPRSSVKPTPKATPKAPKPTPRQTPQPPAAGFVASATSITLGDTVSFTDTSTGDIDAWVWDFGDEQTDTARNPSHAFLVPCSPDPGTCLVRLTVTGPTGSDYVEHQIQVTIP